LQLNDDGEGETVMAALLVSLLLCVISAAVLLFVKEQIERIFFRWKDVPFLHVMNVLIAGGIVATSYYMFSDIDVHLSKMTWTKQFLYVYAGAIELFLPMYILGCWFVRKRKEREKKYTPSKDKKVLYINEKYLARRRDDYHSKTS
jgi:amino acid transporter